MSERPAIFKIHESDSGGAATVTVTLSYQDAEYIGVASGDGSVTARPRLVGEATLRAVQEVTDNTVHMNLEAVATTSLGAKQIAMAQVSIHGNDEALVGTALLNETDRSAATVLDAINRRISTVL